MTTVPSFTESDLRRRAGTKSFDRAADYLGAVDDLEIGPSGVTAVVIGAAPYEVELTVDGAELTGTCSCPYGQGGNFCKHCVAVGLRVLAGPAPADGPARAERLDSWLAGLPHEELLDLLRGQLATDRDLRRRLEVHAAVARASAGTDVTEVRARLADLLDVRRHAEYDHVGYRDTIAFAAQAAETVTVIRGLTTAGRAPMAVTVAREVVALLDDALDSVADSSGAIEAVADRVEQAHHEALRAARAR
jgi:uncharacterized Zn finger protein